MGFLKNQRDYRMITERLQRDYRKITERLQRDYRVNKGKVMTIKKTPERYAFPNIYLNI